MAARKGGLGKGIDSLITNKVNTKQLNTGIPEEAENKDGVRMVKLSRVEPNRKQPRKLFDEAGLEELAASIAQFGILQPLLVVDRTSYYEIIAGERRWRAAKLAGLKEVPVIIRDSSKQEIMEISLIENIQREDLNPIEEAKAYKRLLEEFHLKQEEVAKRVSKSRTAVTNAMRLLKLEEEVQQMVLDGQLTSGHARCLITVEDAGEQIALAKEIVEKSLSVRETERLVKSKQETKKTAEKKKETDTALQAAYESLEAQMTQLLGTKVQIRRKNQNSGKIEICYYSPEELERILQIMQGSMA